MKLIKGSDLDEDQKRQVLAAFIYRWTKENRQRTQVYSCELCDIQTPYENNKSANGHTHPTIPLISDAEWLQQYRFYFTASGKLADKPDHCERIY
jgi:hypothetical protein